MIARRGSKLGQRVEEDEDSDSLSLQISYRFFRQSAVTARVAPLRVCLCVCVCDVCIRSGIRKHIRRGLSTASSAFCILTK